MKIAIRSILLGLTIFAMSGCGQSSPFNLFGPTTDPGAAASVKQYCQNDKSAAVTVTATNNCDKSTHTADPVIVTVPEAS